MTHVLEDGLPNGTMYNPRDRVFIRGINDIFHWVSLFLS